MNLKILFVIFCSFLLSGCNSVEDDNEYFYALNEEVSLHRNDQKKVKDIYLREYHKFEDTHKDLFLISSKFVEISTLADKRLEQIEAIYNLLKLNNNKYRYITTNCNYYLALKFEKSLPRSSLTFIDNAIDTDEKSIRKRHLPHLYHFKGRILYDLGAYNKAILFYNKALKIHNERKQTLFVSSMHNNISMCYEKQGKIGKAIEEILIGITLLDEKTERNDEENWFQHYIKSGLAEYYIQTKQYKNAYQLLLEVWNYSLQSKNTELALKSSKELINLKEINKDDINIISDNIIIDSLKIIDPYIKKPEEKVKSNEIKWNYYSKMKDNKNYKNASVQLVNSINYKNKYYRDELEQNFEISDKTIIENFNKDYLFEKKKNILLMATSVVILLISILIIIFLRNNKKKKIDMIKKDMIIAEGEKKNLAENIKFQEEKIKNFHLILNLKTETEKTFIESLKKIKMSKNTDAEEAVKDLLFRIKNLINLDSKSIDFVNESSTENTIFTNKLADKFPMLTKNDLKFCIYFRLGLASKEISLLENITEASARVYKTKIKSKMKLAKEISLTKFLQEI